MAIETKSCKDIVIRKRMERTAEALRQNNMAAYCVYSREELTELVSSLMNEGETVASGGSMTLEESGIMALLRSGKYNYIDRANYTPETMRECYLAAFGADTYLMSSNAVTENGELYNVDGNGNRVAALIYGPKSVIVIVGANKIVRDLDEAVLRVKETAAPANTERLSCPSYCHETGECLSLTRGGKMTDGCKGAGRICCSYVVSGYQRIKDRVKVIISSESFGY
ncbi:MAG: lactate utilization protein [Huintestinicola sp.]